MNTESRLTALEAEIKELKRQGEEKKQGMVRTSVGIVI